jgi:hypothetical protein
MKVNMQYTSLNTSSTAQPTALVAPIFLRTLDVALGSEASQPYERENEPPEVTSSFLLFLEMKPVSLLFLKVKPVSVLPYDDKPLSLQPLEMKPIFPLLHGR